MSSPVQTENSVSDTTPRVETLLTSAQRDLLVLERRRATLIRSGLSEEHLATLDTLMAFALLGDHEREGLLASLRSEWADFQARGLVHGAIDAACTAELRLLSHCREHLDAIGLVWSQLQEAAQAPAPPTRVWRCPRRVRGLWGEPMRVHFQMDGIASLLIDPDPIFGLGSSLLAADPERRHTGSFTFPLDNGEIRVSMLHRDGDVFRHVVEAMLEDGS